MRTLIAPDAPIGSPTQADVGLLPTAERAAGPAAGRSPEPDLHALYGARWLDGGGLRVNFVASVDGAVAVAGLSRGLQTAGDNKVFGVLRDLADVIVAGSGTVTAENYRPVTFSTERTQRRAALGLTGPVPIAVVSRSLSLDPAAELFTGGSGTARTIVLTCTDGPADRRRALAEVADLVDCGRDEVDLTRARAALAERGLTRVLCEGGPSLFADLAGAGLVDELCLSLSPVLAGPGAGRITAGTGWDGARELTLHSLLEEDGALFLRYRRRER